MSDMHRENNVIVPLFVDFETLQRQEQEITTEFQAEIDAAQKVFDSTFAALRQDTETLRKFESADQALAKATADRLLAENRARPAFAKAGMGTIVAAAKFDAKNIALTAVRDALLKRNHRLYGVGEAAMRTQRFAMAVSRRYHGPASDVVSIESKRA
jgi:hypothetical protein